MKTTNLVIPLPPPWAPDQTYELTETGPINFLVGPNGSGKSRFALQLKGSLSGSRLINTDRLSGLAQTEGLGIYGDQLEQGLGKQLFSRIKTAGMSSGFGLDAFILLEEKIDLRVRVEATLSHLFDRRILLEWESGYLKPKAILASKGTSYDIKSGECHGIKEMLVILTHLYNDDYDRLIIDEPEQNLHPQFQAFFMDEVRKIAGDPETQPGKKQFFLITHSPFILDLRSMDDLKSVVSFHQNHSLPKQLSSLEEYEEKRLARLLPRLRAHHKQLFFSDNPVFVEGHLDAQLIVAMQNALGTSAASAGSCILDVGGKEEVNHYLSLCQSFEKAAYFVYDLDALFNGKLCQTVSATPEISSFLQSLGFGQDFSSFCGELSKVLYIEAKALRDATDQNDGAGVLQQYLREVIPASNTQHDKDCLAKARTALLIFIEKHGSIAKTLLDVKNLNVIMGKLTQIEEALATRNVFILRGGTLENYLPAYTGNPYSKEEAAKREAVDAELLHLNEGIDEEEARKRYGALFDVVKKLPAKPEVDIDEALKVHISRFVTELQISVKTHSDIEQSALSLSMNSIIPGINRLLQICEFNNNNGAFSAAIGILENGTLSGRGVCVSEKTVAGSFDFEIESSTKFSAQPLV